MLDRLVQKNLVSVSHATPRRFNAVPPDEAVDNLMRRIEVDARTAREVLNEVYRERVQEDRGDQGS